MTLRANRRALSACLIGVALLGVSATGCTSRRQAVQLDRLPGVAALAYDGLDVIIASEQTARGDGTLRVLFAGRAVGAARLRPGDAFLVTDGSSVAYAYEIITANERRIIMKRTRAETRVGAAGIARRERGSVTDAGSQTGYEARLADDVVALAPYGDPRALDPLRTPP